MTARGGLTRAEVGDPGIKEMRRGRRVPTGPGGCVGDYVPFYFAPRSPMMYRIACDHRDHTPGRYSGGDRPLVYLASTIGSVIDAGLTWVSTDGNAANATTVLTVDLGELDTLVDWPTGLIGLRVIAARSHSVTCSSSTVACSGHGDTSSTSPPKAIGGTRPGSMTSALGSTTYSSPFGGRASSRSRYPPSVAETAAWSGWRFAH
ncbi:hypothetical protein FHR83_000512 [Actinoplanes campanulatus]|uniref:DarT domain-containing protein n=1 Tax=Actinoplanes campanulatus TaxID=113559 RepID=A0A7W5AAU1_9ACTN|nr:DUF4433 domain-containing protein [Actinoplanes campanulatus]MBB3092878.1 hypothetical protein [Actinoplanes campanulatus]GGM99637.1 hypothetical protein GCM10010109_04400 [Actinoplanes campanulatus]GID34025.1 hypothetical protein Aca09nite_05310 [Actinoplanes campanulatus]